MNATPKRRNAEQTKARILAAAQKAFAEVGYARAGIRDIAEAADISSPMLLRYFGSKAGLFEAALTDAVSLEGVMEGDRRDIGKRLVALFNDPQREITPPAIIALSAGDPDARGITARVTEEHVIGPFARWLGGPGAEARATEIFMLATSFVIYSRQLPIISNNPARENDISTWLAQSIQAIVDEGGIS